MNEFRGYEIWFENQRGQTSCVKIIPNSRVRGHAVNFDIYLVHKRAFEIIKLTFVFFKRHMQLTIKDPSFVEMQNGKHLFDMGQVTVMALFGSASNDYENTRPTTSAAEQLYHYPHLGSDKIEVGIKTKNPASRNLEPVVGNLCNRDFNPFTCLMRLPAQSETSEYVYTLIMQPFSVQFERIYGYYEVLPLSSPESHNITITAWDRWPNNLVFMMIKTAPRDIDYVVS